MKLLELEKYLHHLLLLLFIYIQLFTFYVYFLTSLYLETCTTFSIPESFNTNISHQLFDH